MEVDAGPVPPPQEYSDYPSESSMNFDYLTNLSSGISPPGSNQNSMDSTGKGANSSFAHVDERNTLDRPFNLNERFVTVIDQLDTRVEKFRKDALGLQEKRDFLLTSMDLIKNNELLQGMIESEREEVFCYIQRVSSRLSTVELNVRTVRDLSQEDSLHQVNMLIDAMITLGDPVLSRQRCQQFLNACSTSDTNFYGAGPSFSQSFGADGSVADKKFESALLGCTLDDQKTVKKRLQALLAYLNKQTIQN